MIERVENPLAKTQTRLDQLRSGGAWLRSPLTLLDILRSGRNLNIRPTTPDTVVDEAEMQKKQAQFDSALLAVYGDIILAAANKFGVDFVMRASVGELTEQEQSGNLYPVDELHPVVMNDGGARG